MSSKLCLLEHFLVGQTSSQQLSFGANVIKTIVNEEKMCWEKVLVGQMSLKQSSSRPNVIRNICLKEFWVGQMPSKQLSRGPNVIKTIVDEGIITVGKNLW